MPINYITLAFSLAMALATWFAHNSGEHLAAILASFACGLSLCQAFYQPMVDEALAACKYVLDNYEAATKRTIEALNMVDKPRP